MIVKRLNEPPPGRGAVVELARRNLAVAEVAASEKDFPDCVLTLEPSSVNFCPNVRYDRDKLNNHRPPTESMQRINRDNARRSGPTLNHCWRTPGLADTDPSLPRASSRLD